MMPLSDPAEAEHVLHQRALRPQLRFIPEAPWTNADRGPPWARCVACINVVSLGATLQSRLETDGTDESHCGLSGTHLWSTASRTMKQPSGHIRYWENLEENGIDI